MRSDTSVVCSGLIAGGVECRVARAETVEDQLAVLTPGAGDFLHRLDTGPHDLTAPFIQELASPGGGGVIPELPIAFLQQAGRAGFPEGVTAIVSTFLFVVKGWIALQPCSTRTCTVPHAS